VSIRVDSSFINKITSGADVIVIGHTIETLTECVQDLTTHSSGEEDSSNEEM
jgi:hypothetical protein